MVNGKTDRGRVVVKDEGDGTQTVMVCSSVRGGEAVNVYAVHIRRPSVRVHKGVDLVARPGSGSYTNEVVEVFADQDGTVHVRSLEARRDLRAG